MDWYQLIYKLVKSLKYKMRHRDKLKMLKFSGFLYNRYKWPGICFVTSTLKSWKVVRECWVSTVYCIGIVDSNVLSWNISLPIPGADESLVCLNFYGFFLTKYVLSGKVFNLLQFRKVVKTAVTGRLANPMVKKKKMLLVYFYKRKAKDILLKKKRKELLYRYEKNLDLINEMYNVKWVSTNWLFDMKVFNALYGAVHKEDLYGKNVVSFYSDSDSGLEVQGFVNNSNNSLKLNEDTYRIY